jgi:hypothetical protein
MRGNKGCKTVSKRSRIFIPVVAVGRASPSQPQLRKMAKHVQGVPRAATAPAYTHWLGQAASLISVADGQVTCAAIQTPAAASRTTAAAAFPKNLSSISYQPETALTGLGRQRPSSVSQMGRSLGQQCSLSSQQVAPSMGQQPQLKQKPAMSL